MFEKQENVPSSPARDREEANALIANIATIPGREKLGEALLYLCNLGPENDDARPLWSFFTEPDKAAEMWAFVGEAIATRAPEAVIAATIGILIRGAYFEGVAAGRKEAAQTAQASA